MNKKQEVWCFRGSPAARLLKSVQRHFKLRFVDTVTGAANHKFEKHTEPTVWMADPACKSAVSLRRLVRGGANVRLIAVTSARTSIKGKEWFACLPCDAAAAFVARTIQAAFANIELIERERTAREDLARAEIEREELNRIGVALSSTHDVTALLEMILAKTREITGADAGSLYLVETVRPPNGHAKGDAKLDDAVERRLRFKATQNDSRQFPFSEFTVPISENSLAGYAALHGEVIALDDAYAIPEGRPYHFNPGYDIDTGYRTRSLLTLPMKNARGEVIGLVQLLNCKRDRAAQLLTPADVGREVVPFPARAISLAESLASQAAVAFENSRLYHDIEALFEGFVQAAVTAIEQRDPTTSGHSLRVSQMTVGLAAVLERCQTGRYRHTVFTPAQLKEIRYAALLHDFGKVGVREEILVKAKKLYPSQFDVVKRRFDYARKALEADHESQKFHALLSTSREMAMQIVQRLDKEFCRRTKELDKAFLKIIEANEPTVLAAGDFEQLSEIARQSYRDATGMEQPLLTEEEVRFLSIAQGSLDPDERLQIESHVVHSFNFLMQIPWTREIRGIPEIARAHHEKLDGSGYPYKLKGDEIPLQARMMTICDIFDALSAADRPYKKAVPPERALAILEDSVAKKELDAELFQLFLEGRIYDLNRKSL